MSDLTPPEEPLDDATRARIRERVAAGTATDRADHRTGVRRWAVPAAASAAVAALVVGVVLLGGGDDDREVAPAGSSSPAVVPTPADETPSGTPSDAPTSEGAEGAAPGPAVVPTPTDRECTQETTTVLPGAREGASFQEPGGDTTTFYAAGDRWTLCHSAGATVTVHHPKPLAGGGDRNPYEVSTDFLDGDRAVLVAGGPVPQDSPDFGVTYTFPDGEEVDAIVLGDPDRQLWWLVVHDAADATAATAGSPSVEVRGAPPATPLDVMDLCAQANHGC